MGGMWSRGGVGATERVMLTAWRRPFLLTCCTRLALGRVTNHCCIIPISELMKHSWRIPPVRPEL